MSKFRKAARFVTISQKFSTSIKKQRFEALKDAVKKKKNSIVGVGDGGGLNSKYEQELEIEKEMQLMYNARYEMSDNELSECGSGLGSLIGDESHQESIEDEGSQERDSDEEDRNKTGAMKNDGDNKRVSGDDESVVLDSDIEEMLRENKSKQTGDDDDDDDEEEEDDDADSDESAKSDLELDDIIESGDYDNSSEDASKVSEGEEEDEELNYSALEEEEYDSEAFSFTGITDTTEWDSRMSSVSKISRSSYHGSIKRVEEDQRVDDMNKKIPDKTILEEEEPEAEKAPSITYSRSISDIEEYESDLFDLESEEIERKDSSMYFQANDNSEGDFSIPRAIRSSLDLAIDLNDCNDHKEELGDQNGDNNEANNLDNEAIETKHENYNGFVSNTTEADSKNEPQHNCCSDEAVKEVVNNFIDNTVEKVAKAALTAESFHEDNLIKSTTLERINEEEGHESEADIQANNNEHQKKVDDVLSQNDDKSDTTIQMVIMPQIVTYQQLRKKNKKLLTRKERMEIFKRSSILYRERRKLRYSHPDPEIPSYKAKLKKKSKNVDAVNMVIGDIIERSMKVIEKKESRELAISLMDDVLEEAFIEANKRAKEREHLEITNLVFDDILDMWECKVDMNNFIQNEMELSQFCSSIVHGTLIVAARSAVGTAPYYALHKTPIFKAVENKNGAIIRKKKLMTNKQRQALKDKRQVALSTRETEQSNNEIEKASKSEEEDNVEEQGAEENSLKTIEETKITADRVSSNCDSCSGDQKYVETKDTIKRENAVYIEGEDDISCGLSTSQTVKRERKSEDKIEGEQELTDDVQLQKKESEHDQSAVILNDLPISDKGDYCFQWIMNYGKVPRPPLQNAAKDRNIDARKKRFVRKANIIKERSESEASIQVNNKQYPVLEPIIAPSLAESGASFIESDGESKVSMKSDATLTSIESGEIKIYEEPINVSSINEYFENIMQMKLTEKHVKLRENEEEDEKRRISLAEVLDRFHNSEEGDAECEVNSSSSLLIDTNHTQKTSYESENELIKSESEEKHADLSGEDDTAESILPGESESGEEDQGQRFPTPNSEIEREIECEIECERECEIRTEPENVTYKEKKKKKVWPSKSTNSWKSLMAAVKTSADIPDYEQRVIRLRRNRFQDLSLARPDSLSVPKKSGRTRSIGSNERSKRYSIRTKGTPRSNTIFLPPIVIPNGNKKRQRRNEVESIILPDINRNENYACY